MASSCVIPIAGVQKMAQLASVVMQGSSVSYIGRVEVSANEAIRRLPASESQSDGRF